MKLLARIFMPAAATEADDHGLALLVALAAFSPQPIHAPEPYWKEPGWYEHYFELTPANQNAFDAIVALSEGNWHVTRDDEFDGECDAVWTPLPGHIFLLPEVTWAEIMLIHPNPPAPDQEYLSP